MINLTGKSVFVKTQEEYLSVLKMAYNIDKTEWDFAQDNTAENLFREVGNLQNNYQELCRSNKLSKKAICNLVIPFRDKYRLTDLQALQIVRNELAILEIADLLSM